jgi:hypothetical protein
LARVEETLSSQANAASLEIGQGMRPVPIGGMFVVDALELTALIPA